MLITTGHSREICVTGNTTIAAYATVARMSEYEEYVSQILFADIRVFTEDRISCNPDLMPRISRVCVTVSRASPLISFLTPTSFAVVAAVTGLLVGFHLRGYFFLLKQQQKTPKTIVPFERCCCR